MIARPIGAPASASGAPVDVIQKAIRGKPKGKHGDSTPHPYFAVGNNGTWVMYDLTMEDVKAILGPGPFTFYPSSNGGK